MYKFATLQASDFSKGLHNEWKALWNEAPTANICNCVEWFLMAKESGKSQDIVLFTIRDDKKLVGIFAAEQKRIFGIKALVPLFAPYVVETPFLLVSEDKALLTFFLNNMQQQGNFYCAKVDGSTAWQLKAIDPRLFLSLMSVNPIIDATADPLRHLTSSNRKEILRQERKLSSRIKVSVANRPNDLRDAFSAMVAIDLESGKQQKGMDIFSKAENRELFAQFITHLADYVHIGIVRIDDIPASYIFSFITKKKCLNYQTSYLARFRKWSPGKLIIVAMLRYVQRNSLDLFDFCGGISAYKREFAPSFTVQYTVGYSSSKIVTLWWTGITAVRRIKQRLFPIPNTLDHLYLFRTDRVNDHIV